MKMNKLVWFLKVLTLSAAVIVAGCKNGKKEAAANIKYTCPMHPQIIKDAPGSCPICGMDLVPLSSNTGVAEITLSESQIQLANIKTMAIAAGDFSTSKVLNARLITNPELSEVISSRYAGRIEKLFVKEAGQKVNKGQPLFQVYSEELQTLQQDYVLQSKQAAAFPDEKIYVTLRDAARKKLQLYGYTPAQINNLLKANKISPYITVYARESGIVNEINVSEGQYISEGSPIMRLENFNQLWVEADVYPSEANSVKPGTAVKVTVNGFPELSQTVKINFISPQIDPATQIIKVRGSLNNNGQFQSGMPATVLLPSAGVTNAVALPLDAVLRDAKGAHVWVKTGKDTFAPRLVTTGQEDAEQIIVTSGLEGVKEVVVSGTYLLASEYILKKGGDTMAGHDM